MAKWRRRHPEDVANEEAFWARRREEQTAKRPASGWTDVSGRPWCYRSAKSLKMVGRRSFRLMTTIGRTCDSIPQTRPARMTMMMMMMITTGRRL